MKKFSLRAFTVSFKYEARSSVRKDHTLRTTALNNEWAFLDI